MTEPNLININKNNWSVQLWGPSTAKLLMQDMDTTFNTEVTIKALSYLTQHSHTQLEQKLKEKLSLATPETLQSICSHAITTGQLKILDVCKRVISLDRLKKTFGVDAPIESAQREARITPKPVRVIEVLSESVLHQWKRHSRKAAHLIASINVKAVILITGTIYNLTSGFLYIFRATPSNILELERYFEYFQDSYKNFRGKSEKIKTVYYGMFSTVWKANLVGIAIITAVISINLLHKKLRLDTPEEILLFQNASKEAEEGRIQKIHGRRKEKEDVMNAWNVAEGEKFRIGLLVGPPGCGKTEFVKGLAWDSVNDSDSFVYGKQIYIVNTFELVRAGESYLNEILYSIKGSESEVVLFFDEGHAAGNIGPELGLVELLKTKLLDKNIRCLLGTTTDEFNRSLAHNRPFIDRCKYIDFQELPDEETTHILKDKVELDEQRMIDVEPDTYQAILTVGKNDPNYQTRANPRKSIDLYKDIMSHVDAWVPKKQGEKLDAEVNAYRQKVDSSRSSNTRDPSWINKDEGIRISEELVTQEKTIEALRKTISEQNEKFQVLTRSRKLMPIYRNQYYQAVHSAADSNSSQEAQLSYLFLKHIVRPVLQKLIDDQVEEFKTKYAEEIPLKVDAALIKKLYPASFPVAPVSTSGWDFGLQLVRLELQANLP